MPSNPLKGIGYFFEGFGLIFQKGVRAWVVLPLLVNVLLFGALIVYGLRELDALLVYLKSWLPAWLSWLEFVAWPLLLLSIGLVVFFSFSLVANLISAPFNGLLAEAVERHLSGTPPTSQAEGWASIVAGTPAALADELRKWGYLLSRLPPLALVFFVPPLNLAFPLIWFLFGAWMLTVEYAEFPMGNHALRFAEQRRLLADKRLLSLGFGSGALLATSIPGLNLLAMPVAVAGATALWVREFAPPRGAS